MLLTEYNETEAMELSRKEGENCLFELLLKMREAGEMADMVSLLANKEKRERLYRKYAIN